MLQQSNPTLMIHRECVCVEAGASKPADVPATAGGSTTTFAFQIGQNLKNADLP